MKKFIQVLAVVTPAALAFAAPAYVIASAAPAAAAEAAKSQESVKKGLRIFNQVVGHTGRLVASKSYGDVAHEHEEIIEGSEILRENLAGDMKTKAEPAIVKAVAASTALKDISATKDAAKTEAAHAAFAASVKELIALFPADMHPPAP